MFTKTPALPYLLAACLLGAQRPNQLLPICQVGSLRRNGWTGATLCPSGWSCISQPVVFTVSPGASGPTTTPTTVPGGGGGPSSTTTATGGSSTLVRATLSFGQSLLNTVSDAVLGSPSTAAQFQITGGQLIQNAGGKNLYATVEPRANSTVVKLKVSWSATPATSGTFVFSGDTVEWSNPAITRPQNNAWLVCPDAQGHLDVYINLGPYSYMTPAGCADETIHAYTGATATA
ncbi:hypothetical protein BD779DRAFT_1522835 [Infundibulicybe gibba]|nr:hypothetical protein BD779DRAFT_1522835 [Infundibulicybe gibba]